jgi:hypothetical protein
MPPKKAQAVYKDTPNNRKLNRVGKPLGDPQFKISKSAPATNFDKKAFNNLSLSDLKSILKEGVFPATQAKLPNEAKEYMKELIKKKAPAPAPKKTPKPKKPKITNPNKPITEKEDFLDVLNIASQLGKSKGKSSSVEGKVETSKLKSRINRIGGKVSLKLFNEVMDDFDDAHEIRQQLEENISDSQSYNMAPYLNKVSKTADTWDDLTDNQQERLFNIMAKEIDNELKAYAKEFYEQKIKGKTHTYESIVKIIKEDYGVYLG